MLLCKGVVVVAVLGLWAACTRASPPAHPNSALGHSERTRTVFRQAASLAQHHPRPTQVLAAAPATATATAATAPAATTSQNATVPRPGPGQAGAGSSGCSPSTQCVDNGAGVCSRRGHCCASPSGGAFCKCNYGFTGESCEDSVFERCPNFCSSHGVNCTHNGECVCAEGFGGSDCSDVLACVDSAYCTGHGRCVSGQCECDEGFSGPQCAERALCAGNCTGHGLCDVRSGSCVCDDGYAGEDCSIANPGCPFGCSGHGECAPSGLCQCNFGFVGPACNIATDACPCRHGRCVPSVDGPVCQCEPLWMGRHCTVLNARRAPCKDLGFCSAHGLCRSPLNSALLHAPAGVTPPTCVCSAGYGGPSCSRVEQSVCPAACSSHGRCRDVEKACHCNNKYSGTACDHTKCPVGQEGGLVCSGHGVCAPHVSGDHTTVTYKCECDVGFGGAACGGFNSTSTRHH